MDRVYRELERKLREINNRFKTDDERFNALISAYVSASNQLNDAAECYDGTNEEEFNFLSEYKTQLGNCILLKLLERKGYYQEDNLHRWKKSE